jgi:glutathionylspermidine synthase
MSLAARGFRWHAARLRLQATFTREPDCIRQVLHDNAKTFVELDKCELGDEGCVYRELATLPDNHAVIGSWIVDAEAAGIGIREPRRGERITTNTGRFVSHLFE